MSMYQGVQLTRIWYVKCVSWYAIAMVATVSLDIYHVFQIIKHLRFLIFVRWCDLDNTTHTNSCRTHCVPYPNCRITK